MTEKLSKIEKLAEAADRALKSSLREVAALAADENGVDRIGEAVAKMAEAEGAYTLLFRAVGVYRHAIKNADLPDAEDPDEAVTEFVTDTLLTGADDSWSGRGNDVKRAKFDGTRAAARRVLRALEG